MQEMKMPATDLFYTSGSNLVTITFAGADSLDKAAALEQKVACNRRAGSSLLRFFFTLLTASREVRLSACFR
jgi:hypothetical protein